MSTTGHLIRAAREATGLSLSALSDLTGYARQSVYDWEADRKRPTDASLAAVASACGVPLGALYEHRLTPAQFAAWSALRRLSDDGRVVVLARLSPAAAIALQREQETPSSSGQDALS